MSSPSQRSFCQHHERLIIAFHYNYHKVLVDCFEQLPVTYWSRSQRGWHPPDSIVCRKYFGLSEETPVAKFVLSKVDFINKAALKLVPFLRNSTLLTLKRSLMHSVRLRYALKRCSVSKPGFTWCLNGQHIQFSQLHHRIHTVQFYFKQVLRKMHFFFDIPQPQKLIRLPKAFKEEAVIKSLLCQVENQQQKIRRSE